MAVTAITVTGTGIAGGISYSGTYEPAGLDPVPVITIDALVDTVVMATEEADSVGGGTFSGVLTVANGLYTLRAEAVGGTEAESDPVAVPNTGTGAVVLRGPSLAGAGTVGVPGATGTGAVVLRGPSLAGAGTVGVPGATGTGAVVLRGPSLAGAGTVGLPGITGAGAIVITGPGLAGTGAASPPVPTVQPPPAIKVGGDDGTAVLEPKDPSDVLDYWFDWSRPMASFPTDTISATSWAVTPMTDPPMQLGAAVAFGTLRGVFLSGGQPGAEYRLTCAITTALGRTLERSAIIYVEER